MYTAKTTTEAPTSTRPESGTSSKDRRAGLRGKGFAEQEAMLAPGGPGNQAVQGKGKKGPKGAATTKVDMEEDVVYAAPYKLTASPETLMTRFATDLAFVSRDVFDQQAIAIENFSDFLNSSASAEAKPKLVAVVFEALADHVYKEILGEFTSIIDITADAMAVSMANYVCDNKEKEKTPEQKAQEEQKLRDKMSPEEWFIHQQEQSGKAGDGAAQAGPTPAINAFKVAGKCRAGLTAGYEAYKGAIKKAAAAAESVNIRNMLVSLRTAAAESAQKAAQITVSDSAGELDSAFAELGRAQGDSAWKPGNTMAFAGQADFLRGLSSRVVSARSSVMSSKDVFARIVADWVTNNKGAGAGTSSGAFAAQADNANGRIALSYETSGEDNSYEYTLVSAKVNVASKQGQCADMVNKLLAEGRPITGLGIPVDVWLHGPNISGGSQWRRFGVGASRKENPTASPELNKRWKAMPQTRIDEVKQVS